jgi:peptidoglycan/LPS O-acetylase OafA/YrhL
MDETPIQKAVRRANAVNSILSPIAAIGGVIAFVFLPKEYRGLTGIFFGCIAFAVMSGAGLLWWGRNGSVSPEKGQRYRAIGVISGWIASGIVVVASRYIPSEYNDLVLVVSCGLLLGFFLLFGTVLLWNRLDQQKPESSDNP